MGTFRNYQYYNFKGGLDYQNAPPLISQTEKEVAWADGYNVELLDGGGICKMGGTQLYMQMPEDISSAIIAGFEGEQNGNKYLVVVTQDGKFYHINSGKFILKKENLAKGVKPNFKNYLNGVFVSNGIDEPFLFVPNSPQEINTANAETAGGHEIRGNAIEVYKGRIWIADGSTLYYSALGKYNDWMSENDAGSISNFHNDTSPITALCCYKDALVIHKREHSFILTGNSPENFVIQPFSNLGAKSPWGINVANGKHLFFNEHIYPFLVNELGEIVQGSAVSLIIEKKIKEFQNVKNDKCLLLNYKSKSQLWCFLYKANQDYFQEILIFDYQNNAWFLRKLPYKIVSAWESDNTIYTGLNNGIIAKEAVGSSFLGEAIGFKWCSPFFHFGQINSLKTVENLALIFSTDKDNNFDFQVKKNYSNYTVYDKKHFSNINSNTLVFCDDDFNLGQGVLDGDTSDEKFGYVTLSEKKIDNYFANITGANKSIQIEITGKELYNSLSLLGLEFRDVYVDL